MKITVILQGKLRNKWASEWIDVYRKRLSGGLPLEIVEWGTPNKSKEEKFFSAVKPAEMLVALDEGGKSFTSASFAAHLDELKLSARTLYLFVGEAYGHSETVLKYVSEKWSLSDMTMSYEVTLVMLAEQLYRALTIQTGHPYHK